MKKLTLALTGVVFVVCGGVLATACGGGSTPGVATLSGSTTSTTTATSATSGSGAGATSTKRHDALAFSKCMRAHGVHNYPDPTTTKTGGGVKVGGSTGLDPNSPAFQAAQKACRSLLPRPTPTQLKKIKQQALAFSKCMRAHGVTNFPDPKFSSTGFGMTIGGSPGSLDPNSPTFQAAQKACRPIMGAPGNHAVHL